MIIPLHRTSRVSSIFLAIALAAVLGTAASPAAAASAPAVKFIRAFGSGNGMQSGPGQLATPWEIAVAPSSGDVLVADSNNNRIQEFRQNGKFRSQFGTPGGGHGQLSGPHGIGINKKGDIYVGDGYHRIQEFSPTRHFIRSFGNFVDGPGDIAVAPSGDVFAVEGSYIQHYTGTGKYLGSFGGAGTGPGQFSSTIAGLAVGPNGHVYAGDYSGGRVEEFTYSGASGTYVRSLANSGQAQVQGPIGVAVTKSGIFVSDNGNERGVELSLNGSFVRSFANSGSGKLDNAGPMASDCRGDVYISDIDIGRVREYGNPKGPRPPC